MPVQVFDNGLAQLGYTHSVALCTPHNGADVVNISMGLTGLENIRGLSPQEQLIAAKVLFKNHER